PALCTPSLHVALPILATALRRIAAAKPNPDLAKLKVPDPLTLAGKVLDDEQRGAVVAALRHPLSVATGLPGTGKTVLIEALAELDRKSTRLNSSHVKI